MSPKLFELRPNRSLLNSNFNGYKLSLEKVPVLRKELETQTDRVLPDSEQYSLLHAKIFGLHNHLFTDYYSEDNVYFVDKNFNVQKVELDKNTGRLNEIREVFAIPRQNDRKPGHYNVSILFPTDKMAVLSDGAGILHIINTGIRAENETWHSVFSDEVLGSDKGFILQDSVIKISDSCQNELHCLLINIDRPENSEKFSTIISWVTFSQTADEKWGAICLRVLEGPVLYYSALEKNCDFIYVASDKSFKFTLDSKNPISDKKIEPKSTTKTYSWVQTREDIILRFNTESQSNKNDFEVNVSATNILVKYKNKILLNGDFVHRIDPDLTIWSVTNNILEITISKSEIGLMWNELVSGDENGEQILDPSVVAEVHERLAHLCTETDAIPEETGPAFSSQQIEECDFDGDNTVIFERISGQNHEVTHRANLGSHQVIMTVNLDENSAPAIAIRHDVDACLWKPTIHEEQWSLEHEGTLLAFGYVQASKQQRKFSTCSQDLNYSVICESKRHLFIYRQNRSVNSGELRNRKSGQKIGSISEQQVISLSDDEILGISAKNDVLYLLTESYVLALKIQSRET